MEDLHYWGCEAYAQEESVTCLAAFDQASLRGLLKIMNRAKDLHEEFGTGFYALSFFRSDLDVFNSLGFIDEDFEKDITDLNQDDLKQAYEKAQTIEEEWPFRADCMVAKFCDSGVHWTFYPKHADIYFCSGELTRDEIEGALNDSQRHSA